MGRTLNVALMWAVATLTTNPDLRRSLLAKLQALLPRRGVEEDEEYGSHGTEDGTEDDDDDRSSMTSIDTVLEKSGFTEGHDNPMFSKYPRLTIKFGDGEDEVDIASPMTLPSPAQRTQWKAWGKSWHAWGDDDAGSPKKNAKAPKSPKAEPRKKPQPGSRPFSRLRTCADGGLDPKEDEDLEEILAQEKRDKEEIRRMEEEAERLKQEVKDMKKRLAAEARAAAEAQSGDPSAEEAAERTKAAIQEREADLKKLKADKLLEEFRQKREAVLRSVSRARPATAVSPQGTPRASRGASGLSNLRKAAWANGAEPDHKPGAAEASSYEPPRGPSVPRRRAPPVAEVPLRSESAPRPTDGRRASVSAGATSNWGGHHAGRGHHHHGHHTSAPPGGSVSAEATKARFAQMQADLAARKEALSEARRKSRMASEARVNELLRSKLRDMAQQGADRESNKAKRAEAIKAEMQAKVAKLAERLAARRDEIRREMEAAAARRKEEAKREAYERKHRNEERKKRMADEKREKARGVSPGKAEAEKMKKQKAKFRWEEYSSFEKRWNAFLANPPAEVTYANVPWPVSVNNPMSITGREELSVVLDRIKASLLRWHPDKFQQRFGRLVVADERKRIMRRVGDVFMKIRADNDKLREKINASPRT
eukprot:jgi/Mesvir1/24349/Mv11026-RA.1